MATQSGSAISGFAHSIITINKIPPGRFEKMARSQVRISLGFGFSVLRKELGDQDILHVEVVIGRGMDDFRS